MYNNFSSAIKLIKKKVDITICGISGIYGLQHLLKSIEISKKVGVANKESIICGWNLIKKSLYKNQTKFIPLDSEDFSLWRLIQNKKINDIKEVFLTASGGPFLNKKKSDLKNIKKLCLHATKIGLKYSSSDTLIEVDAPIYSHFKSMLEIKSL